jgi:enoyl-CoA hydratase/carnithine racemase
VIDLSRHGDVFVLTMDDGENRLNRPLLDDMNRALDEVEAATADAALVTTGTGKFYSNGLDLDWLATGPEDFRGFVADVERLMGRLLGFPMTTVAAVNGHCFAAGAMVALCHDIRIMRKDRGWFCLPEVDIKIPFTEGMNSLIVGKLNPPTAHEAMVTGKRFTGEEAFRTHIASAAVAEDEVLPLSIETARSLAGKDHATIAAIKRRLYAGTIELLGTSVGTAPPT